MGFFDKFTSSDELTPKVALATAMIYMMASDGNLADEEMIYLSVTLNALGEPKEIIDSAVKYAKKHDLEAFIEEANSLLTPEQKMTLLANLIDLLLADGDADEAEEELFSKFADSFGVSQDELQPYIDIISTKNQYSLFQD